MYGYIYVTTNLINGRKYIGQHAKPEFDESYYGSGTALKPAIKKYGIGACCRKEQKTSGGFMWMYKTEYESMLQLEGESK